MSQSSHKYGKHPNSPSRSLGLLSSLAIVMGSMLGIGIFLAPVTMATHINSPEIFMGVWIFTGVVVLSGATSYAELGVMFPQSGGDYVFHREALGHSAAFAYGWGLLSAGFAGSIAAIAVPLCTYQLSELSGFDTTQLLINTQAFKLQWAQVFAIVLIVILTLINVWGVWLSKLLQIFTSYIPILLLGAISILVFMMGESSPLPISAPSSLGESTWTLSGLSDAFLQAYFAYAGWNAIIYTAGEVKNPAKTLPLSLIGGTIAVMALYLALCGAALYALRFEGLRLLATQRGDIGTAMAKYISEINSIGAVINSDVAVYSVTVLIALALIATINATVLGGSRVAVALAQDKCFWQAAADLHPHYGTPTKALFVQAFIAVLAVLLVPWHLIFSLVSLVMVVGGSLTVIALYILRVKAPMYERKYKAIGYPIFPGLFIAASLFVLIIKLRDALQGNTDATQSLIGLLIIFVVYTLHLLWQNLKQPSVD
jgi:basic amino acid/polyamine antiporter, APA family